MPSTTPPIWTSRVLSRKKVLGEKWAWQFHTPWPHPPINHWYGLICVFGYHWGIAWFYLNNWVMNYTGHLYCDEIYMLPFPHHLSLSFFLSLSLLSLSLFSSFFLSFWGGSWVFSGGSFPPPTPHWMKPWHRKLYCTVKFISMIEALTLFCHFWGRESVSDPISAIECSVYYVDNPLPHAPLLPGRVD